MAAVQLAARLSRHCHVVSLVSAEDAASMAPSTARSLIVRVPNEASPDTVRLLDIFVVRHAGGYACYENRNTRYVAIAIVQYLVFRF